MKIDIKITGTLEPDNLSEYILEILGEAGVTDISYEEHQHYEDWLSSLPEEDVPDLRESCIDWIRCWGNGGGDLSSETCITNAINELESNNPKELAEAIYGSIDEYSKSKFDATALTINIIDESMEEIMVERREAELNYEEENDVSTTEA